MIALVRMDRAPTLYILFSTHTIHNNAALLKKTAIPIAKRLCFLADTPTRAAYNIPSSCNNTTPSSGASPLKMEAQVPPSAPDVAGGPMGKPAEEIKKFLGGIPTPTLDVPITAVFLIFFGLGAFLHITTYKANAKRGHKFLLSSLMFDFCMVRVVTCIFRILWAFIGLQAPGVVLVANVFQNGG